MIFAENVTNVSDAVTFYETCLVVLIGLNTEIVTLT